MPAHTGILELSARADGRLRVLDKTLHSLATDPVVPAKLIERYALRPGLRLEVELGQAQQNHGHKGNGRHQHHHQHQQQGKKQKHKAFAVAPNAPRVQQVLTIDGLPPEDYTKRRKLEDLTVTDPQPRLTLEYPGCPPACRLIDLFCPIGYGQRGMIVSPPKAGKTILLQQIAFSISRNHPQVHTMALLIDERPEEVTDFRRHVPCEVLASSNDHTPEKHVSLAILAVERAKRMCEAGRDVVVLLDSLTRVGRAFNTVPGLFNSGRTLTGGIDAAAMSIPRQLFGAARHFEEGGSLTIIATCLIDTGSKGDQVIFEEFKGTGNMEMILDRKISDQRVFPAIDLAASGTRKEHLLMSPAELQTVTALRRRLNNMKPVVQIEQLLKALERFKTNAELVGGATATAPA